MSRIPYPERDQLSVLKRAYLDAPDRRVRNIVRMAMHTPDRLWETQRDLATACALDTTIEPRLREVLILRVGALSHSEYELHHHRTLARQLGMDDAQIRAIEHGDFARLGPEERAVAQFTTEVVEDVSPTDATLAATRALFSDAAIFEMLALIGVHMMTARLAAVGGVAIDDGADEEKTGE